MGHAHILYIYNDGIRDVKNQPDKHPEYAKAVGEAVLKLCLNPDYASTPEGQERVTWHSVFNHGNCVEYAGEVHSTDALCYVWLRNGLRTLDQLNDDELDGAKRLFDDLYAKRKNRSA